MLYHTMDLVRQFLNRGQVPVVTPLCCGYATSVAFSWYLWSRPYCCNVYNGLHIELAALKTIGDWLEDSGWINAVWSGISWFCHISRTIHAHELLLALCMDTSTTDLNKGLELLRSGCNVERRYRGRCKYVTAQVLCTAL